MNSPLAEFAAAVRDCPENEIPVVVASFNAHFVVMSITDYNDDLAAISECMADKNRELDYLRDLTGQVPQIETTATGDDL